MKKIAENSRMISSSLGSFDSMAENTKLMVELAQTLKAKLKNREGNDEVANVLQNIGYVDPVTKESFGENYETHLAKQIDEFFGSYLEKKIITLTDAFCIYNRARGISFALIRYYFPQGNEGSRWKTQFYWNSRQNQGLL